jgi:lipopolysaccharide/colanic/teichoic acid biosynthesis glycosyltransferase
MTYEWVKRSMDAVLAAVGLVVLGPLLAATALVVAWDVGAPVLYRQSRAGRYGRPFTLVKFRTMRPVDAARGLLTDAERLTATGRALRARSLDELPSLWNVLRGDLSLVGPRPLPAAYLDRYSAEQARRNEVRPGVTGLAQVRGRNALSWDEKLRLDVAYVDRRCLALDLRVLLATARVVVRREGIAAAGHATAPEFRGPADRPTGGPAR